MEKINEEKKKCRKRQKINNFKSIVSNGKYINNSFGEEADCIVITPSQESASSSKSLFSMSSYNTSPTHNSDLSLSSITSLRCVKENELFNRTKKIVKENNCNSNPDLYEYNNRESTNYSNLKTNPKINADVIFKNEENSIFKVKTISRSNTPIISLSSDEDENSQSSDFTIEDIDCRILDDGKINSYQPKSHSAIINSTYVESTSTCILLIRGPVILPIHGRFSISVMSGSITILGYKLVPQNEFEDVFSPRGNSFVTLDVAENNGFQRNQIFKIFKQHGMLEKSSEKFLFNAQKIDSIIALKFVERDILKFMEKYVAQQFLPTTYLEKNCQLMVEKYLQCHFMPETFGTINFDEKIQNLMNSIISDKRFNLRVMFCGGKGVGKSTMTRYFTNKLLQTYKKVLYVDLDPGQPEFTIPGCVSATIVKKPLFGPNFTHPLSPERCIFVKDIDVSRDPQNYLECIKVLRKQCEFMFTKNIPTVINFMGFTRFLGLKLVAASINIWQPSDLFQIQSYDQKVNYSVNLTMDVVCKEASIYLGQQTSKNDFQNYTLHLVESSIVKGNTLWKLQARQVREMMILSYFSQMIENFGENNSIIGSKVPTIELDYTTVQLRCFHYNGPHSFAVLNGSLVGIGSKIYNNIYYCHGWGIIRAINESEKKMYITTPLNMENLNFDSILMGNVMLPATVYMSTKGLNGRIPFISVGIPDPLSRIPKKKFFLNKIHLK